MKNRRAAKPQGEFLSQIHAMLGQWDKADPSSFGLTDAHVQRLKDDYDKAAAAHARVLALQAQLTQAMAAKKAAMGDLRRTFGGLSTIIDGLARTMRDPSVYTKAAIKKPEKKGPLPKPEAPTGLELTPRNNGGLTLTFKIDDGGRGNLMYEVRRRCEWLDGRDWVWEPVAVTPRREVVDDDVPTGLRALHYQVRAKRTNGKTGEWSSEKIFPFGSIASAKGPEVPAEAEAKPTAKAQAQVEAKPVRTAKPAVASAPGEAA